MIEERYIDCNGRELKVGTRVLGDPGETLGTVTQIDPPDGDVDDEGRGKWIYPKIHIKWDDGWENDYTAYPGKAYNMSMGEELEFECDELEAWED